MVTSGSPILATDDIRESLRHYTEVLKFSSSWTFGDPPTFGGVSSGSLTILFSLEPELTKRSQGQSVYINAEEIDALYASQVESGAHIVSEIEDKPWNMREYTVRDPHGYLLRFGSSVASTAVPSRKFPEDVRIERRMPTLAEHRAVAGPAFYGQQTLEGVLERTWRAVVAVSPEGEVVGEVRIMWDAPGWFSIWDVAVQPDWQGQRIGQKLMQEALEIVGAESPGAWVFLFTYKDGFYERLGFSKQGVMMRKV